MWSWVGKTSSKVQKISRIKSTKNLSKSKAQKMILNKSTKVSKICIPIMQKCQRHLELNHITTFLTQNNFSQFSEMILWYEQQLAIKDDRVFAVSALSTIPVWDLKTGQFLYNLDTYPGPEKGIQIFGSSIVVWTPMEAAIYKEDTNKKLKLSSEQDLTMLGLDYLTAGQLDESGDEYSIQFIHRNLVGVQLIQNVLAICYIINDVNRDSCLVKLAFLPMKQTKGKIEIQ